MTVTNELLVQLLALAGGLVGVYVGLQRSIAKISQEVALLKMHNKYMQRLMAIELGKQGVDVDLFMHSNFASLD